LVLFLAALLTAFALDGYQEKMKSVTWLAIFIPLIISSGGNSGNQSATLIITSMTTGDVGLHDFWRVLGREMLMGITLGGCLGLASFLVASMLVPVTGAAVVLITVFLVVVCGTLCGAVLPILFRRLGLDPALMSNPFVAGIVDILGIIIYMTVATKMMWELSG
jgi:magnesium transporter